MRGYTLYPRQYRNWWWWWWEENSSKISYLVQLARIFGRISSNRETRSKIFLQWLYQNYHHLIPQPPHEPSSLRLTCVCTVRNFCNCFEVSGSKFSLMSFIHISAPRYSVRVASMRLTVRSMSVMARCLKVSTSW